MWEHKATVWIHRTEILLEEWCKVAPFGWGNAHLLWFGDSQQHWKIFQLSERYHFSKAHTIFWEFGRIKVIGIKINWPVNPSLWWKCSSIHMPSYCCLTVKLFFWQQMCATYIQTDSLFSYNYWALFIHTVNRRMYITPA